MTDIETWQNENGRYLAASLTWLRLRLQRLGTQSLQPGREELSFYKRLGRAPRELNPRPMEVDAQLREAADARAAAARMNPPPALLLLGERLRLTPFERDLLLLCAAMEFDTRVPGLCARAVGSLDQPHATFALALSLFDSPAWDALSAQRPLRYWRLIEVNSPLTQQLTSTPLRADERIVNYLKGINALDERLAIVASLVEGDEAVSLPASQQEKVDSIVARWERAPAGEPPPIAVLLGTHADAKLIVARQAAAKLDRKLFRIGADSLPAQATELEALARMSQRESALLPLALYIDTQVDGASPDALAGVDRFVSRAAASDSPIFVGSREPLPRLSGAAFTVDVARPTMAEQHDVWVAALSDLEEQIRDESASRLASQFSLNASEIRRLVKSLPLDPVQTMPVRLWDACRERTRPRLDTLAQRIDPQATWDHLVITEETERLLREIVAQVEHRTTVYQSWGFAQRMNRGLGISALFAGESGTGKTMAAEVIANALRLSLYRIDLSQVVSKYIGETEKNLQRVFDVIEGGGAILFFDEADALFGKRSEVRDSHDRYANIEINYLLQKMESYTGLAILATNMQSALDKAFVRRLRFIVPFHFPNPGERRRMWSKAFPKAVPTEVLDLDQLAKLPLTGASIQNVALNAAFLAAKSKSSVTMPLVMKAVRTELRKIERPVSEAGLKI